MTLLPADIDLLMQEWDFCVASGDVPGMLAICTEDIEIVVHGVAPIVGRERVGEMLRQVFTHERMLRRTNFRGVNLDRELAVLTADVAVKVRSRVTDELTEVSVREVMVLRRFEGRWKVSFNMTNMMYPVRDVIEAA